MAGDAQDDDACSVRSGDSLEGFILEEIDSEESPHLSCSPTVLVETVLLEDAISNATDETQWLVVDQDGGELEDEVVNASNSDYECDAMEQVHSQHVNSQTWPEVFNAEASAAILWSDAFQLGSGHMVQDGQVYGDVTTDWAAALKEFPAVPSVFCLGRIIVSSEATSHGCLSVPAVVRVVVVNNGPQAWPEGTALRIVAGDALGLDALPCDGLPPQCAAELLLDLMVPAREPGESTFGKRSAWVLTDGYGRPFGPLLTVEVVWVEE